MYVGVASAALRTLQAGTDMDRDGFPENHKEACWEDLGMQDISAGPIQPYEAFDHGYRSAMARCADAVQTCRAIAEGAGIMGDPATYPDYVRTMCRNAIAELEPPA